MCFILDIILWLLKLVSNKIDTYLTSLWRHERYWFSVFRGILPPVNFLFDNKTLIGLLESLFSSLSVNFNWNDCNWEFNISIDLKSGYLSFALESTLKKELVIENVRAICWIVPKKYLLLLDQTILLHFRSNIDSNEIHQ
jgi:hypothetical protein